MLPEITEETASFHAMLQDSGIDGKAVRRFRTIINRYYRKYGRHDLPWRHTDNPYHILISEIMLQQTQVDRVMKKYLRFVHTFPNLRSLARAPTAEVLKEWKGLGYNRRALSLQKTAQIVTCKYDGTLPSEPDILTEFPGIGHATASSICAFAFNRPVTFIETNIRRIFIHFFFQDREGIHDRDILPLVEKTLVRSNARQWYSALMDFGSALKKEVPNPNVRSAHYTKQPPFRGSRREIRGKILGILMDHFQQSSKVLATMLSTEEPLVKDILSQLCTEGFLKRTGTTYTLA